MERVDEFQWLGRRVRLYLPVHKPSRTDGWGFVEATVVSHCGGDEFEVRLAREPVTISVGDGPDGNPDLLVQKSDFPWKEGQIVRCILRPGFPLPMKIVLSELDSVKIGE